jgi:hypothetical protein
MTENNSNPKKCWTVITEQDPETGDLILPLPEDLLEAAGFSERDDIEWTDNGDGSYTLAKQTEDTEWVLVDAISQYHVRYLVEVPKGKTDYALDTVACEDAKEFSQEWLGETTVTHRVITEQEGLDLFRSEEPLFENWDDDTIKKNHFTFWVEDDESNNIGNGPVIL